MDSPYAYGLGHPAYATFPISSKYFFLGLTKRNHFWQIRPQEFYCERLLFNKHSVFYVRII